MSNTEFIISKLVAVGLGMLSGAIVHFVSRATGLEVTIGGSLFACAFTTAGFCSVRWVSK